MTDALRHYCRNSRCRTKLREPVENEHAAFCCRGCFEQFYRSRCAVCERDLSRDPIGILAQGTPAQLKGLRFRQSFLDGMQELGYIEGRDFDIVVRAAETTDDLPRV